MWILVFFLGMIVLLLGMQSVVLLAFNQPLSWTFGGTSQQPKSLRLTLKVILQSSLVAGLVLFPSLLGSSPGAYFGPRFPTAKFHLFWYGELFAVGMLCLIFAIETACGWIHWKPRWPAEKAVTKSCLSALSSITVVSIEEPLFRGVLLQGLLNAAVPALFAIPLSAAIFSGAHFIRKVRSYWPAVGLGVLGLWLGVAYARTGSFWLPMGLHSGGILAIGVHRCFLNYRGREWLVGTQTFPIAGVISIAIMLAGTVATWLLFR